MKHIFMHSILFKSHLIRHSTTGREFKDIQRALEEHSESTQRRLRHCGTRALEEHSEGTRALKALVHSGT